MSVETGILLESGTGEVEVLEFVVAQKHYAINVIKTKEIFEVNDITRVPNSNKAIAGMTLVRGNALTVIDLKCVLEKESSPNRKRSMALLCEFNKTKVAFLVDEIIGIHRIGWNQIEKPDSIVQDTLVIGNIVMNEKILMLLDFEKVVMDIRQSYGAYEKGIKNIKYNKERSDVRLILADDSVTIRTMLNDVLTEAGYTNLTFFDDGQQVLDYLNGIANEKELLRSVGALITDIEMPRMDGHTLTRKIKEHSTLKDLPVIIFSSLITDDLHHKGESVGADAQMSKPEIDNLVKIIDKYTLK